MKVLDDDDHDDDGGDGGDDDDDGLGSVCVYIEFQFEGLWLGLRIPMRALCLRLGLGFGV